MGKESIHAHMLCHKAWSWLCRSNAYVDGKGVYKIGVLHLEELGFSFTKISSTHKKISSLHIM